jgi:hypothetical protein
MPLDSKDNYALVEIEPPLIAECVFGFARSYAKLCDPRWPLVPTYIRALGCHRCLKVLETFWCHRRLDFISIAWRRAIKVAQRDTLAAALGVGSR